MKSITPLLILLFLAGILFSESQAPEPYACPEIVIHQFNKAGSQDSLCVVSAEFETEMDAQVFKSKVEAALHGK